MKKKYWILLCFFVSLYFYSDAQNTNVDDSKSKKVKKEKDPNKESFVDYFNFPQKAVRDYTSIDGFQEYAGLEISQINVYILNRLVEPIADNDSLPVIVQDANNLKENFNKKIIYNQLLFEYGDKIDPLLVADSERNIRVETIFKDAIINVTPQGDSLAVIDVFIQDNRHWKMIFAAAPTSLKLGAGFKDFGGLTQTLRLYGQGQFDLKNPYSVNAFYKMSNLGGSQISIANNYIRENLSQAFKFKINRKFFAYNTKVAGKVELDYKTEKIGNTDFSPDYNLRYLDQDYWLARSFPLKNIQERNQNMRFIMSSRATIRNYIEKPIEADSLSYGDKQFYLGSFGIATRDWVGYKELYYFRQYDYVPKGYNLAFVGGYEIDEFSGKRWYSGMRTSYANQYPKFGYLETQLNYGAFFKKKDYEQITLQIVNDYFTNKIKVGKLGFRQFVKINSTFSFDRPFHELYNVSNGISGLKSNKLKATKSLVLNFESVFYTPIKWWTSRSNFFFFADLGMVSQDDRDFLLDNNLYQGYGMGIRFQNLATAIYYMEISFGIYPNGYRIDAPIWNYNLGFEPSRTVGAGNLYGEGVLNDIY
ncbi:MAG: hypothetical protein ACPG4Z_00130 [Chitinophagales bacterium]